MSKALIIDPGRRAAQRGFVFIVALGAMAILVLVAATANLASVRSYQQTGRAASSAQLELIVQSSLDAIVADAPAPLSAKTLFETDEETTSTVTISAELGAITELEDGDAVYREWGIAPAVGDVKFTLTIEITPPNGETQTFERTYLWNPNRLLARPVLVSRGA